MKEIVAKKYVDALFALKLKKAELDKLAETLDALCAAFDNERVKNVILMPSVKKAAKLELLMSFVDDKNAKFGNFLKLLAQNGRLELLPQIAKDFRRNLALKRGEFSGMVAASFALSKAELGELKEKAAAKFGVNVELKKDESEFNGIRLSLDELGYEVAVSNEKIAAQMQKHILKGLN